MNLNFWQQLFHQAGFANTQWTPFATTIKSQACTYWCTYHNVDALHGGHMGTSARITLGQEYERAKRIQAEHRQAERVLKIVAILGRNQADSKRATTAGFNATL